MLSVNVLIKNSPVALTLNFKAFKNADETYRKITKFDFETISLEDDYDMKVVLRCSEIAAVSFSDYSKDMDKNGELQILQEKSNLKTQSLARSDIALNLAANGPKLHTA